MAPNKSKRKHYTPDMKAKIIREYDTKPFRNRFEVLDKYGIGYSSISNWKEKGFDKKPAVSAPVPTTLQSAVENSSVAQTSKAARLVIRLFLEEKISEDLAEQLLVEVESK